MTTPILDFAASYAASAPIRLHMPGHKGEPLTGSQAYDITEIDGADVLYHADGIIRESEENAAALFGTYRTFYSCEGSSLCIRAMLQLALLDAKRYGRSQVVLAARNAHKGFLCTAALLDFPIVWLYPPDNDRNSSILSCRVTPDMLRCALREMDTPPAAVYLTSPDYLGNLCDIRALAEVCHAFGAPLLCDNAHGAYTHFLPESLHPMDLGADLCCDSAHKTLPALTGAAYLHISKNASARVYFAKEAERVLSLFASTSPSYLILQSLDALNACLCAEYPAQLLESVSALAAIRQKLQNSGYTVIGDEPQKLTLAPKSRGYTGVSLAAALSAHHIIPEFYDPDYLVLMNAPAIPRAALDRTAEILCALPKKPPIAEQPPMPRRLKTVCTPREAMLAPSVTLPLDACIGRVLASPGVSCPPAVPIAVCGEMLDEEAAAMFRYYGIQNCTVMDEGKT
ncbi:MAG: amino acid decarboxylase [Clostridia bacterium]|nr:amino acid decarboxylase [Clostridia bacterium]